MYMFIAVTCTAAEMVGLRDLCVVKRTVLLDNTVRMIMCKGCWLAELKARQWGLGSLATVHSRKLGGTHTLIENCLKDGQRHYLMYS